MIKNKKIAFITAVYGDYEASCRNYVNQTIPTDFICFTNNNDIISNHWIVDSEPYHHTNPSMFDDGSYVNSLKNNNHTFNIAKFYKQSFHNIPRLKDYDVVVWLDGTIEIINPKTAEWVVSQMESSPIISWEHYTHKGLLKKEVDDTKDFYRYSSTFWFDQKQPYQDIRFQYKSYIRDGYDEKLWFSIDPQRKNLGVWSTCFVAFNNNDIEVHRFLDLWYLQTLRYTTQDQVSFPYVVQKSHLYPYTLPDAFIKGNAAKNHLFVKHYHNKQNFDFAGDNKDPSHVMLHTAVFENKTEIVESILESRVDVRLNANPSFYAAVMKEYSQLIKMFLDYGIEINQIHSGATALYWAVQEGFFEVAKILLNAGADTEIKAKNGNTPLIASTQNHNFNMVKLLVEAGANLENSNNLGATPLFIAAHFGYNDILQLFLDNGANKNVHLGVVSVFQNSLEQGHGETAQLLSGSVENFCQEIQGTTFQAKYIEICGEVEISSDGHEL
ncbi:MAG: ankyrin repeat domain-containing protein [Rickettsiales bacterium]|jgi:ankyrin repeat protein|nr:ankyrin repeat domain-containing protein [Rickettsiales bacterium]